jgi:hypothetical protein
MWFAALGARTSDPNSLLPEVRGNAAMNFYMLNYGADAWFLNFMVRLLQGSPAVLGLMEGSPFRDAPPRFVRARLFNYEFADAGAPMRTGAWWVREERGMYLPPMSLGE